MEAELDTKDFIVIDNGSGYIKAGWSGEDSPRVVVPSIVGKVTPPEPGKPTTSVFGNSLNLKNPASAFSFPIERGVLKDNKKDLEDMKDLWYHILRNELNQQDLSNTNVLITDAILNSRDNKTLIAQIFFENFGVNSLGIMPAPVLSLFATGRARGVVVESGEALTSIVPIFEGFALPHTVTTMNIAGQDITKYILKKLEHQVQPRQFAVARGIKDQMTVVAYDYREALTGADLLPEDQALYELPSGEIISVNKDIRLKASEILFSPELVDSDSPNIQSLTVESINRCDRDLISDIYSNIVVSGGTSMMKGFPERLEKEVKQIMSRDIMASEIQFYADSFRQHGAWIGGSMLASMSTFPQYMVMTKAQWETDGIAKTALVHKYSF